MRRSSLALLGILTACVPVLSQATIYEDLKKIEEHRANPKAEHMVERFIVEFLRREEIDIDVDVVDEALAGNNLKACEDLDLRIDECEALRSRIAELQRREQNVRALGRDLQTVIGGYEAAINERPRRSNTVHLQLASLLRIWQAETDPLRTESPEGRISIVPYPNQSQAETLARNLEDALKELEGDKESKDALAGAVFRYRYGYRTVGAAEGDCNPVFSGSDDLAVVRRRWCAVEAALDALWQMVAAQQPVGNPSGSVFLLYPSIPMESLNVLAWVHEDDAGLAWEFPLEPTLPELIDTGFLECLEEQQQSEGAADHCAALFPDALHLGGLYPPEPTDPDRTVQLCAQPMARYGYLCRPLFTGTCAPTEDTDGSTSSTAEGDGISGDPRAIVQTTCQRPDLDTHIEFATNAGPNICGVGAWNDTAPFVYPGGSPSSIPPAAPQETAELDGIEPDTCSRCAVDLFCRSSCPSAPSPNRAVTYPKGGNAGIQTDKGTMGICLPEAPYGSPALLPYLAIHEVAKAQQQCSVPSVFVAQDTPRCCAAGYTAYLAACSAMGEDGLLQDVAGIESAQLSPSVCASILANLDCPAEGSDPTPCSDPPITPDAFLQAVGTAATARALTLELPASCAQAVTRMDDRVRRMIDALPSVCSTACQTTYESTIGNHLCYAGQCVEQTIEEQRLVSGRMPLSVGDEAFPWDACLREDPAIGTRLVLPPLSPTDLPPYRPAVFAQQFDAAVCQVVGAAPGTAPIHCDVDTGRQTDLPLPSLNEILSLLFTQKNDETATVADMNLLAPGHAALYGTTETEAYLRTSTRALGELLRSTNEILDALGAVSFPNTMCARSFDLCPQSSAP